MKQELERGDQVQTIKVRPVARTFANGRYQVERLLGVGGHKRVFLVRDTTLERECALALLKPDLFDAEDVERLHREARAMARLGAHPNLVTVFDVGDEDGRPYLVSEYVPGGELRDELVAANGALQIDRALTVLIDIAEGLSVAHGHGVIHRDLKPSNIWLTSDGGAKLGDFGLAGGLDRSRLTLTGALMGTAAYMSPEQGLGRPADARSDLYAMGCIGFELATGRPPFTGEDAMRVISAHISDDPASARRRNGEVPVALEALLSRLLAKSPDGRPSSAHEAGAELRRIRSDLRQTSIAGGQSDAHSTSQSADAGAAIGAGFIGRREEMSKLGATLERVFAQHCAVTMLIGEAGIGKTRLSAEFGAYARARGARVVRGRCYEGEFAPPFSPFVEAIVELAQSIRPEDLLQLMGSDAGVLARIVPALREQIPHIPDASNMDAEGERFRTLDAVAELFGRLADEAPLALLLEDLHWADKGTAAMLRHVARRARMHRMLIVGTYRDIELDTQHPLTDALAELRRDPAFERIAVRGLDSVETGALVESIAGRRVPARVIEAISKETDGNPFFIKEVLLHLVEERALVDVEGEWLPNINMDAIGIPESVREVVGRRLARQTAGCRAMLTAASAMAGGFEWDVMREVIGSNEDELIDSLEEALRGQLLVERSSRRGVVYEFTHALIRQTLYDGLSGPRGMSLHRRIGETIELVYADDLDGHLSELSYHFFQAAQGDVARSVEYAERAGNAGMVQAAFDDAAAHYARALHGLDLMEPADNRRRMCLLLALGESLMNVGNTVEGRARLQEASRVAEAVGDGEAMARAALNFGWGLVGASAVGSVDEDAAAILQAALVRLSPEDSELRARAMSRLAAELAFAPDRTRAEETMAAAMSMARRLGTPRALAEALQCAYWLGSGPENCAERLAFTDEALADGNDEHLALVAGFGRIVCLCEMGEVGAAIEQVDVQEELARRLHQPYHLLTLGLRRAMIAILLGNFAEAESLMQEMLVEGNRLQSHSAPQAFAVQLAMLRRDQGRLLELEAPLRLFAAQYAAVPAWRAGLALVLLDLGREDEAGAILDELADRSFAAFPRDPLWLTSLAALSEVAATLGDVSASPVLYEHLLPYTGQAIAPIAAIISWGAADRNLAMLASAMGRFGDAERHFQTALRTNDRMGARPWLARTQYEYAKMLLKRGSSHDNEQARELLDAAAAAADSLGMPSLQRSVAGLAKRLNGSG